MAFVVRARDSSPKENVAKVELWVTESWSALAPTSIPATLEQLRTVRAQLPFRIDEAVESLARDAQLLAQLADLGVTL